MQAGAFQEALDACNDVLESDENNVHALCDRAEAFILNEMYEEAINDYSAALDINKHYIKAYRLRSSAYFDNKEYTPAIIDASHIKLYDEKDPFALNMIEKCYIQTSPRERIVIRSNVAEVMRARRALLKSGKNKRYLPSPTTRKPKVAKAKKPKKKKCGPRRRS